MTPSISGKCFSTYPDPSLTLCRDRRKLTFYFIAEKRIDFRELVRELFRLYKTRIWMASLQGGVSFEQ